MKNIKFKFQYKPLTEEQINKNKNFDSLFAAYSSAPIVKWYHKLPKNNWWNRGIGFFLGALIVFSSMTLFNTNIESKDKKKLVSDIRNSSEVIDNNKNEAKTIIVTKVDTVIVTKTIYINRNISNTDVNYQNIVMDNQNDNKYSNKITEDSNYSSNPIQLKDSLENYLVSNTKSDITIGDSAYSNKALTSNIDNPLEIDSDIVVINKDTIVKKNNNLSVSSSLQTIQARIDSTFNNIRVSFNSKYDKDLKNESILKIKNKLEKFVERNNIKPVVINNSDSSFTKRPVQISFLYPIGSDGNRSDRYEYNLSVNLIQGYVGSLNGVEFGGFANIIKGSMKGAQFSGFTNINRSYIEGAQFSGFANITKGNVSGAQFSGFYNSANMMKGAQFAGFANINSSSTEGIQAAGFINIAYEKVNAVQLASFANFANNTEASGTSQISGFFNISRNKIFGVQLSGFVNVAKEISGTQIGIINSAKHMNGTQIGLINFSDTLEGVSIGLINYSRHGIFGVDLFANEANNYNAAIKFGNKHIYNLIAIGVNTFDNSPNRNISYAWGLGGRVNLAKHAYLDIDGMCWDIHKNNLAEWNGLNLWNQLRVIPTFKLNKYFAVYAGPTLNVQISNNNYIPLQNNVILDEPGIRNRVTGWLGFTAGIELF